MAVKAQEEGEGRDKRRKQEERKCICLHLDILKLLLTNNNLKKLVRQALMTYSTSSRRTEEVDAVWQTEPKKRVKEEMKGGNMKKTNKCFKEMLAPLKVHLKFIVCMLHISIL